MIGEQADRVEKRDKKAQGHGSVDLGPPPPLGGVQHERRGRPHGRLVEPRPCVGGALCVEVSCSWVVVVREMMSCSSRDRGLDGMHQMRQGHVHGRQNKDKLIANEQHKGTGRLHEENK